MWKDYTPQDAEAAEAVAVAVVAVEDVAAAVASVMDTAKERVKGEEKAKRKEKKRLLVRHWHAITAEHRGISRMTAGTGSALKKCTVNDTAHTRNGDKRKRAMRQSRQSEICMMRMRSD
jgi:hypothetical protein